MLTIPITCIKCGKTMMEDFDVEDFYDIEPEELEGNVCANCYSMADGETSYNCEEKIPTNLWQPTQEQG